MDGVGIADLLIVHEDGPAVVTTFEILDQRQIGVVAPVMHASTVDDVRRFTHVVAGTVVGVRFGEGVGHLTVPAAGLEPTRSYFRIGIGRRRAVPVEVAALKILPSRAATLTVFVADGSAAVHNTILIAVALRATTGVGVEVPETRTHQVGLTRLPGVVVDDGRGAIRSTGVIVVLDADVLAVLPKLVVEVRLAVGRITDEVAEVGLQVGDVGGVVRAVGLVVVDEVPRIRVDDIVDRTESQARRPVVCSFVLQTNLEMKMACVLIAAIGLACTTTNQTNQVALMNNISNRDVADLFVRVDQPDVGAIGQSGLDFNDVAPTPPVIGRLGNNAIRRSLDFLAAVRSAHEIEIFTRVVFVAGTIIFILHVGPATVQVPTTAARVANRHQKVVGDVLSLNTV